jgi:cytochrome c oxidase subunit 2
MKLQILLKLAFFPLAVILLSGCDNHMGAIEDIPASFSSNGERIYFTGVSANGTTIQPAPISSFSNHMVRSCASCHGAQRQGGIRMMPFFWIKSAPLTRQALFAKAEHDDGHGDHESYIEGSLAAAIRQGIDPAGKTLSSSMPRWNMSDADMQDMIHFLQQ